MSLKIPCKLPLFPEFSIYKFPNIIDSDDQLPDLPEVEQEPECENDQHVPEVNIHETSPQSETHKSLPEPESQEITEKQPHLIRYT